MKLGLIGKTLAHSFSKQYFNDKFKQKALSGYSYKNFEMDTVDTIRDLVKEHRLDGFNVTIPYKEAILPYLDHVDSSAQEIGAINTVKVDWSEERFKLTGYNTDVFGFHQLIKPFFKSRHERILILGTGGASKAVAYLLKKQYGATVMYASRKATNGAVINWEDINDNVIHFHKMIINTTPLGTFPNVNEAPKIPLDKVTNEHLFIDLIYNPKETLFLKNGKAKGAVVLNGLTMLHQQAEKAWEIWHTNVS
ncbi:MAG: shikimate dehydrogenase [Flavobacteriales bacterium]|jgi:shikimate dehydrogenase|nr:shikimate dehydrogenase [Flavobacteriales bacterium]